MSGPLQSGDPCMVVRDTMRSKPHPCHGALIGSPVTLACIAGVMLPGLEPVWRIKAPLTCPRCESLVFTFAQSDLQKLNGPGPSTSIDRDLHEPNEVQA